MMNHFLTAWVAAAISLFAQRGLAMACQDIDLRKRHPVFRHLKVSQESDGHDYRTCQSGSAARLLEGHLSSHLGLAEGETVSWMSLALNARAASPVLKDESFFSSQNRLQLPCEVIAHAARGGVCVQKSNGADAYFSPQQYVELRREFSRFQNASRDSKDDSAARIQCILHSPDSNLDAIRRALDATFSNQFLASLVDSQCVRKTPPLDVKCESVVRRFNSEENDGLLGDGIHSALIKGKPSVITVCSSLGKDRAHMDSVVHSSIFSTTIRESESCGMHAATVIGSKPYVDDNGQPQCKILVEDTYAEECLFGVPCEKGISEIDSKVLLLNTLEVDFIR